MLYSTVRDYIGDIHDMTVFDLFSGTGTIAQVLAPVARQVIGVEIVEEAWEKSTYGESTPITDVIKSTDTSRNPIAGGEYCIALC